MKKSAKDLASGLNSYLDKTTKESLEERETEETIEVPVHFKASPELKKRMDLYCVKHDLKKKNFFNYILEKFLEEN